RVPVDVDGPPALAHPRGAHAVGRPVAQRPRWRADPSGARAVRNRGRHGLPLRHLRHRLHPHRHREPARARSWDRGDRMMEVTGVPLDELMAQARQVRDLTTGTRITYSPKVFIPLTMLCRDRCGYCTFAQPPARLDSPFLEPDQVLRIARAGARAGCHEALFTLGEAPEDRYPVAAQWLAERGYGST